ncbi:DUF3885 domain-containing protein [Undibacterium umbellatum]|uniref:DUF3885 domain-containing protein n=1 Tax=Undibacterium umbellatum TaxID=2762300 RepID=A0ABR6ZHZ7_9BURK|nr:DUF3885 domain-containing protein [Undibacterium umbellatum]MBC3911348.1 DUF3885 domain-containing protein [Undibacterium umbellatum]
MHINQEFSTIHSRITSSFKHDVFARPLFYTYPAGLRFELSESGSSLDQFMTAMRKATSICKDIFAREAMITVCLQKIVGANRFSMKSVLRELHTAGISIPRQRCIWTAQDEDDQVYWVNLAFEISSTALQSLLWCAFAFDFSIRPNPHCKVYLFNLQKGIAVFPYDDRGMDVAGENHELLLHLYNKYNRQLLDCDRLAMDATFTA